MPNSPATKISRTQRQSQSKFGFTLFTELRSQAYTETIKNLQIVLNAQKKSLLKSSYLKKYLPNFSYPKNSKIKNFNAPKNPLIIPVT